MSRFDYRDPGQDPEYCNALSNRPEPDVMDDSESDIEMACGRFRFEIARARTPEDVHRVWQRAKRLEARVAEVTRLAAEKSEQIQTATATCFVSAEDHQTYWGV